ncbi:glutamate synthase (ferredoxin) [Micromonospora sp. L5]|uniref:hypothetical protein n=1 Tax=Micromonospora sp. (strain L5) TaxID=648999 RepID=UPI0001C45C94|nr:hypothetical protein [Micromonospora sp. L5]ADU06410.1 glutamate synthase (ferredoxin) [Micromonospora sp. L5]
MPKAIWMGPDLIRESRLEWDGTSQKLGAATGSLVAVLVEPDNPHKKAIDSFLYLIRFRNLGISNKLGEGDYHLISQTVLSRLFLVIEAMGREAVDGLEVRRVG